MDLDLKQIVRNKPIISKDGYGNSDNHFLSFSLGLGGTVTVTRAPTANCQLYSIGAAMNLFRFTNWPSVMALLHRPIMKKRVLIDVPTKFVTQIKEFFSKDDIIMENNYVNSTYSTKMTLLVLSTTKLGILSREMLVEENKEIARLAKEKKEKEAEKIKKALEAKNAKLFGPQVKRKVGRPKKVVEVVEKLSFGSSEAFNIASLNARINELVEEGEGIGGITTRRRASRPMTPAEAIPVINVTTHEELVRELDKIDDEGPDLSHEDDWDDDKYSEQEQQELEEAENRAFEARMEEEARIANSEPSSFNPF